MLSEQDVELAHPEAFDSHSATSLGKACRLQPPSHRLPLLPSRRRRVQRDRRDHPEPSASRRTATRPRRPDGRGNGHCPGGRRPAPIANLTPRIKPPPGSTPSPSRQLSPKPGSTDGPSTQRHRLRLPVNRQRPSRKPGRSSLACPCGAATLGGWWLCLPWPPPSYRAAM